jgi:hypothetical protein
MANPQLTPEQRKQLFASLFDQVRKELERLSNGDPRLLWALRRKLTKELGYLERGTPAHRAGLKAQKYDEQVAFCAMCGERLPLKDIDLDRIEAYLGYTAENTRLVHHKCHIADQKKKRYA